MSDASPVVTFEQVTMTYGAQTALRGVAGTFQGGGGGSDLLGPNGAGKSTLLNCLMGFVRRAIDLSGGESGGNVTTNDRLMGLMAHVRAGDNPWVVGQFDGPAAFSFLPGDVASRMPPIAAMAIGGLVNGDLSASLMVETRDEQTGQDLHSIVQGFLALARLQMGSRPDRQKLFDSIQLMHAGRDVTLAFDLPAEIFELVAPQPKDGTQ